jgi:hypothetical protein
MEFLTKILQESSKFLIKSNQSFEKLFFFAGLKHFNQSHLSGNEKKLTHITDRKSGIARLQQAWVFCNAT